MGNFSKIKMDDVGISLLGTDLREMKVYVHTDLTLDRVQQFYVSTAPNWK